jgi:RNA polymerase sigma-70 factor (ECF subfamily)
MQQLSDEQLIKIFQNDQDGKGQAALGYLYDRYAGLMLNFFYFSLHFNFDKAQDFVHDLFVRIIEKKQTFDNNHLFKAWIYRIASNMCKNEFRSYKVSKKYTDHVLQTSDDLTFPNESEKLLRECINKLSPDKRALIVLRFRMKLTVKEIAEVHECAEGTIKSRLFYATKELSELYKT